MAARLPRARAAVYRLASHALAHHHVATAAARPCRRSLSSDSKTTATGTSSNAADIQQAFSLQASRYARQYVGAGSGAGANNSSKKEWRAGLQWIVRAVSSELAHSKTVLDVSAGTGALTRLIAPHCKTVTAFDLTPAMLAENRRACQQENINNVSFVEGDAVTMPQFADNSFDIVCSRFAMHHWAHPQLIINQMARVLKPGGLAFIVDIVTAPKYAEHPHIAARLNHLEKLRDPSHVRFPNSSYEISDAFRSAGLTPWNAVTLCDRVMPLNQWFDTTHTPADVRKTISDALTEDMEAALAKVDPSALGTKSVPVSLPPEHPLCTGFRPHRNSAGELCFFHGDVLVAATK